MDFHSDRTLDPLHLQDKEEIKYKYQIFGVSEMAPRVKVPDGQALEPTVEREKRLPKKLPTDLHMYPVWHNNNKN